MTTHADRPDRDTSDFICPGCGKALMVTLRSDMCFAEAQLYCAECERDYQERRGKWADRDTPAAGFRIFPITRDSASPRDE